MQGINSGLSTEQDINTDGMTINFNDRKNFIFLFS